MPSVTLTNLQDRIYSRLDNNTTLYTSAEVTSAINEQLRIVNLATGYIQTTGSVATVSNQVWYTVPAGIIVPMRMKWNNVFIERCSLNNLGEYSVRWLTETTANKGIGVSKWALAGLQMFAIYPADSVAGNTIVITGIAEPTILANGTDVLPMPNEYSEVIEDLAVVALILKEGGRIFADAMQIYKRAQSKLKLLSIWQLSREPAATADKVQPV